MSENKKLKMSAKAKVKPVAGEPLKVEFAPGCFDHIDVENQEELDAIMAEITSMFANMTPEELRAQSQPIDWENIDDRERAILEQAFADTDTQTRKNRLQ
jgi:hypothetical protein